MSERDALRPARAAGLLLAGGRSRRFGAEKAVALFAGRPMMDAAADCFAGMAYAVSARPGSAAEAHARTRGLPVLHDAADAPSGPLAGVLAGLEWATSQGFDVLATAPCDAPLLPRSFHAQLLCDIGDARAAYALTSNGEHPLCAVWRVSLLAPLRQALANGRHPAVRAFLAEHGAVGVRFEDAAAFANANTADALALLEHAA